MNKTKNVVIIVLIAMLIGVLNTTYEITVNNITYKQKIIDYILNRD